MCQFFFKFPILRSFNIDATQVLIKLLLILWWNTNCAINQNTFCIPYLYVISTKFINATEFKYKKPQVLEDNIRTLKHKTHWSISLHISFNWHAWALINQAFGHPEHIVYTSDFAKYRMYFTVYRIVKWAITSPCSFFKRDTFKSPEQLDLIEILFVIVRRMWGLSWFHSNKITTW